jgi:hypothetical protein
MHCIMIKWYTTLGLSAGTIVPVLTVGKWHHIALTVDSGGNAVGYVNGYPVVSGTRIRVLPRLVREVETCTCDVGE